MVHPAWERSSRTPTISAYLVARARAFAPGDIDEDPFGYREEPHAGAMSIGIRSSMVKNLEDKGKKRNMNLFMEA